MHATPSIVLRLEKIPCDFIWRISLAPAMAIFCDSGFVFAPRYGVAAIDSLAS